MKQQIAHAFRNIVKQWRSVNTRSISRQRDLADVLARHVLTSDEFFDLAKHAVWFHDHESWFERNINRFFILFSTHDKCNHSQKLFVESFTTFRRFVNVVQINNSQNDINALTILHYKFKSFLKWRKFLKKLSQSMHQNNSITQNI